MRRLLPLAALAVCLSALSPSSTAPAQTSAQPSRLDSLLAADAPRLSADARVSLLTMAPGREVYSLWGHNAFRIQDPARGLDRVYNYGTFDFQQPGFVLKFLGGRLDYFLATAPYEEEIWKYEYLDRTVVEQPLALTPETTQTLFALLEENAEPENRDYRYDFLRDNCSTRLLDVLDSALVRSGQPRVTLPPQDTTQTFRDLVEPYDDGQPLTDWGTSLGLGAPMDQTATPREAVFLPLELMRAMDGARIGTRPIVASRDTLFAARTPPSRESVPWPMILAWLALAVSVGGTIWMRRRLRPLRLRRWAARGDGLLFVVAGLAGAILLALWFATEHYVTAANVELLWLWPTHLVAAFGLARVSPGIVWRRYALVAAVGTGLVVALWWLWPEPMHPAGIPVALLLAFRAAMRARVRE